MRECFGLRWAKIQLPLSVAERNVLYTLYVYLDFIVIAIASLEERAGAEGGHQDLLWERNRGL